MSASASTANTGRHVMADITLTDVQAAALRDAKSWFETGTEEQHVFSIAGYAGTGKSTIVKYLVDDLGLDDGEVLYGTFTGKAAYVLRKKGTPCRTIHSHIYKGHEASEQEIAATRGKLEALEKEATELVGVERALADAQIQSLRAEIKEMRQPRFGLNEESEVRDANLVVLGDPGQLPPIKGAGAFARRTPDVMLTEIHRQAAESAVIRLATMARQGETIAYGQHDELVWKMSSRDVTAARRASDLRQERDPLFVK